MRYNQVAIKLCLLVFRLQNITGYRQLILLIHTNNVQWLSITNYKSNDISQPEFLKYFTKVSLLVTFVLQILVHRLNSIKNVQSKKKYFETHTTKAIKTIIFAVKWIYNRAVFNEIITSDAFNFIMMSLKRLRI